MIRRLWTSYRQLPLSDQFVVEWLAFAVVCVIWIAFVIGLAVG